MAYGSGISAQFGYANEGVAIGTIATPDHFIEFNSESLELTRTIVQGQGLRAGGSEFNRASRRVKTTVSAGGGVQFDAPTNGLGLLLKHMMGSSATATQIASTAAYAQIHTPGNNGALGLTLQKGVPQTDGTVKSLTYAGGKVSEWTLNCGVGEIATFDVSFDAWNETTATALATATYTAGASVFHFAQGVLKLGGTPSTSMGEMSVSGGTTAAEITGASVTHTRSMKTDRFYFGSAGIKANQIVNDYGNIGGSLTAEFVNQATIYDVFAADTAVALQLTFTGADAGGGNNFLLDVILPNIHFDAESPKVGGPDVVGLSAAFTALDPGGSNATAQVKLVSTDTAL